MSYDLAHFRLFSFTITLVLEINSMVFSIYKQIITLGHCLAEPVQSWVTAPNLSLQSDVLQVPGWIS